MNQPLSMDQVFLNRIREIIDANLENEKFGVEEVSREIGMSRSNINRKLKSIQKNSISQFIQEIRLQRAMEMLQQKVATASEISFRVGFSSPTYFNKCFHEYYGFPPGEVKKLEEHNREKASHMMTEPITKKHKKLIPLILVPAFTIILMLIALSYFFKSSPYKNSPKSPEITGQDSLKSIAVLPFKNLNNDPEQEYFSDGMMEEILSHLFMIGGLRIPSSTSTMRFKGSKLSLREIARELGVSYLLEGNVSRAGHNVRIIVRLVNGDNEQLLWTEDYNREMTATDLHEIQSDVAQRVAENMNVVIEPEVRKRIITLPTENTEAYTLYLSALQFNKHYSQSMSMLERAVALDSGFADAYALMAYWRMWHEDDSLSRDQMLEKVEPLLNKALQLDKSSMIAHAAFAEFRFWFYWDFETVEKELQIFRQISPSNTEEKMLFSQYLWAVGKFREAYILCKDVFDDNKILEYNWVLMAISYFFYGQPERALETIETALRLFPQHDFVINNALSIFVEMAKYKQAIQLFEKYTAGKEVKGLEDRLLGDAGIAYFKNGNKGKANSFLKILLSRNKDFFRNHSSYYAAKIYLAAGERDKALQCLGKAYSRHELVIATLKTDPFFRSLHGDPRFEDLLKKIGFK